MTSIFQIQELVSIKFASKKVILQNVFKMHFVIHLIQYFISSENNYNQSQNPVSPYFNAMNLNPQKNHSYTHTER